MRLKELLFEGRSTFYEKKQQQMAAMIEEMDRSIGRVLDALEKAGVTENTYIIFTSDNGGYISVAHDQLRGKKGNLLRMDFEFR